ncbi:MAG TPA: sugar phosphate isomerase/epimerase [Tepidisphaeraceae bacterium]|nr:sugar phosphate isomerase/epimerase [Tepidisphaeraceae bacterium]
MNSRETRFILTAYGLPHVMGYLATRNGKPHPQPLTPVGLMDEAVKFGLAGVEFPLSSLETSYIDSMRDALDSRGLLVVTDYMVLVDGDCERLRDFLKASARLGAKVARAIMSTILCGDRRPLAGGWEARLEAVASRLREVLPLAQDLALSLALENHQDATTDDFIRLYETSGMSPAFGVTLDTGNPLSVGEEPVEAARRLAPLIRHLHLKDYTIHFAPEGYRLVRCAAGRGVIDFPAILDIVCGNGTTVTPGIEIAAQPTRTVPLLEAGWWACYPRRDAHELAMALKILWASGRPVDEPYSSAWERGDPSEVVAQEEWRLVRESVEYFKTRR